jgi:hypothetical protein
MFNPPLYPSPVHQTTGLTSCVAAKPEIIARIGVDNGLTH